jgi:cell division protein FtsB
MDEGKTIEQLRKENEQLRLENGLLKAKVSELE